MLPTLACFNLFFSGLLAGTELAAHHGFDPPVERLDEKPQIVFRQAVTRRLRVMMPALFLPTLVSTIVLAAARGTPGPGLRFAQLALLAAWAATRAFGTIRINAASLNWNPDDPPRDWRARIGRAKQLHVAGVWAAVFAFAAAIAAT